MKKTLVATLCAVALIGCDKESSNSTTDKTFNTRVKVLSANLWHDLDKGYDQGLAEMQHANADVILTQESDGVNARLAEDLGMYFVQGHEEDASVGILSKFPIVKVLYGREEDRNRDRGGQVGAVLDVNGREVVVWDNHLDWKQYTAVEPRGLDGNTSAPHANCAANKFGDQLDNYNAQSYRPEQAEHQNQTVEPYLKKGTPVIIGGDFNEPTGEDWKQNNQRFDRNGSSYDFSSHRIVRQAGFVDTFRKLYPNANEFPGITWPVRNDESWTKSAAVIKGCTRKIDDRDRIDFIYYNQNAAKMTLDSVAFVGPRYSDHFHPVDGEDPSVYKTYEPHEGLKVVNGEPTYGSDVKEFPSDHLWYSASFTIKTPGQVSTAKSLDLNPRFDNLQLATDGSDLIVGFNIQNWSSYIESGRDYFVHVTCHAGSASSRSGGIKQIIEKPSDDHPLAINVSNEYLQQLKKSQHKLQLRIFSNVAGSPKVYAAKSISMDDIEKVISVELPPEPSFEVNGGQAIAFEAPLPMKWAHATNNADQWIAVYRKGDSPQASSRGWVYARTDLDETNSVAQWQVKPSQGEKVGEVTLPSIQALLSARAPELRDSEYDIYLFGTSNGADSTLAKQTISVTY
ncbi:endonuclease/exonuclease/phosphatase family protein [Vibrio sp. SCSIO 43136]|uniref:endonuclease/exonuclease/phosphatase family protein n=1 Tax=Vibrio sp. SCSIO 43136 TaxID=2819101 RepID=UPI0020751BE1|nr:endonuclease/exonuclease/phosphatase family protein [Vibrio sp. SCSIO 43136]USD66244.1 endonuclease/exonuclease/phosphatase family protein [Vibrio sp. SCSIO 43136]